MRRWLLLLFVLWGMPALSCNATNITPTTPPTASVEIPATETPNPAIVTAQLNLNIRSGPGEVYDIVGVLLGTEVAPVLGKSEDGNWWLIACPNAIASPCWVTSQVDLALPSQTNNVAIVVAPPTPTPVAGPPPVLAYVENGNLIAMPLNLSGGVVTTGSTINIVPNGNVTAVKIMPDGQSVAYLQDTADGYNTLNTNGIFQGNPTQLADTSTMPPAFDYFSAEARRRIGDFGFLPNNAGIYFSTQTAEFFTIPSEDLWIVPPNGTAVERFPTNTGEHVALSDQGVLLMGNAGTALDGVFTQGHILRSQFDGTNQAQLAPFDFIITYSEFKYSPSPQWTNNDTQAYVAIPSSDVLSPNSSVSLWQIPLAGDAEKIGEIAGNFIFTPITWSDNGAKLAYAQFTPDSGNRQLIIADNNGQNPTQYGISSQQTNFLAWHPDNTRFLYTSGNQFHIGQLGNSPDNRALPPNHIAHAAHWVTNNAFIIVSHHQNGTEWAITSGTLDGATVPILTSVAPAFQYDLWVWSP